MTQTVKPAQFKSSSQDIFKESISPGLVHLYLSVTRWMRSMGVGRPHKQTSESIFTIRFHRTPRTSVMLFRHPVYFGHFACSRRSVPPLLCIRTPLTMQHALRLARPCGHMPRCPVAPSLAVSLAVQPDNLRTACVSRQPFGGLKTHVDENGLEPLAHLWRLCLDMHFSQENRTCLRKMPTSLFVFDVFLVLSSGTDTGRHV
ncbi:hypothetical protein DFH08DRAFT_283213 [Mycena albidolilacea]|uniref:Uncharacterized protein n=1 Tax=Mycena albidolilacea TaxID=1033008 RepID=A0AAD7ELH2_9AGAR|nr:hypothetical protein DFH08DRAFT_283213 [Mycena albidolilacea]